MKKKITIKDIASELGISPTTVSLILNNRPCRVSDQTRLAVLDCVKKYHYLPNSSARSLVMKKTQTIGLIVPDISNPFFSDLAKGVEQAASREKYSVMFCNSNDRGENDIKNFEVLISKQVDGIILASSIHSNESVLVERLFQVSSDNQIPVVLADRVIPGSTYSIALIDHRKGAKIATDYLLSLGHKKVGCITGPLSMHSSGLRYQGYLDSLLNAGITPNPVLCHVGDYQMASGMTGAEKLIKNGADAIFSCNDLMAAGALRQAKRMGKIPGQDISIIGFDNIQLSSLLSPPLTTVNQPVAELGSICFQILFESLHEKTAAPQNILLNPELIVRDSTISPA